MPRSHSPIFDGQWLTLLRKAEVAMRLGVHTSTIDRWIAKGKFPAPIFLQPGSPAKWRESDVSAFIEKRRASRRPKPNLRGALREFDR
jgi:excisionase family DNA binding protein